MPDITDGSFGDDGSLTLDGPTIGFIQEQAGLVDGQRVALSLNPVVHFYGVSESEALGRAARWSEKNVDGQDVVVLATWFRFIDEELDDGLHYECSLVLEVC